MGIRWFRAGAIGWAFKEVECLVMPIRVNGLVAKRRDGEMELHQVLLNLELNEIICVGRILPEFFSCNQVSI